MKEYKILVWIGVFIIFVIVVLVWLAGQSVDVNMSGIKKLNRDGITLFYGEGCPHCKDVKEFNEKNNIKNKVTFEELEVWKNKNNAKLMNEAAKICKFDLQKLGVPFLFAKGECFIGGPDVKNFFKKEAGLK